MLQINNGLVNICFQQKLALWFKVLIMFHTIITGAMILQSEWRTSLSMPRLVACIYVWIAMNIVMAAGFYFPGKANETSRKLLKACELQFQASPGSVLQSQEKSLKEIRIHIGTVNYYERDTALNLMDFLVGQTKSLVLLM